MAIYVQYFLETGLDFGKWCLVPPQGPKNVTLASIQDRMKAISHSIWCADVFGKASVAANNFNKGIKSARAILNAFLVPAELYKNLADTYNYVDGMIHPEPAVAGAAIEENGWGAMAFHTGAALFKCAQKISDFVQGIFENIDAWQGLIQEVGSQPIVTPILNFVEKWSPATLAATSLIGVTSDLYAWYQGGPGLPDRVAVVDVRYIELNRIANSYSTVMKCCYLGAAAIKCAEVYFLYTSISPICVPLLLVTAAVTSLCSRYVKEFSTARQEAVVAAFKEAAGFHEIIDVIEAPTFVTSPEDAAVQGQAARVAYLAAHPAA